MLVLFMWNESVSASTQYIIYITTLQNMITMTYFLIVSQVDGSFSLATRAGGWDVFQNSLIEREYNEYA
jgi:hypothetical protein